MDIDRPVNSTLPRILPGTTAAVVLAALCVVGCDSGNHPAQTPADTAADITTSGSPAPAVYTPGKAAARSQPGSAEDLVPGTFRIDFFGTEVSILANGVNEKDILSRLANQAGFELTDTGATWKVVTLNIAAASVHAALVQLLKPHQYQIIYEFDNKRQADILNRVVVNERGGSEKKRKRDTGSGITTREITKHGYPDGNFADNGEASTEKQQIDLNQLPPAERVV